MTSQSSKSMVIRRSLISIVDMDQTGGWGVDLWRRGSTVAMATHRIARFYV